VEKSKQKATAENNSKLNSTVDMSIDVSPPTDNVQKKKYIPKKNYYREKKEAERKAAELRQSTISAQFTPGLSASNNYLQLQNEIGPLGSSQKVVLPRKLGVLVPLRNGDITGFLQSTSNAPGFALGAAGALEEVVETEFKPLVVDNSSSVQTYMSVSEADSVLSGLDILLQHQPYQDHPYAARRPPHYSRENSTSWQDSRPFIDDVDDELGSVPSDVIMRILSCHKATPNMLVIPMIRIGRTGYLGENGVGVKVEGRDWTSTTGSEDFNHRRTYSLSPC